MKTLAQKYKWAMMTGHFDIEKVAVQADQNYEKETTYWIFEDGSALAQDGYNNISVINNYGLSVDHQQLKEPSIYGR